MELLVSAQSSSVGQVAEEHKEDTSKGLKEETKVNFSISNNSSPVSHVSLEEEQEVDFGVESGEDEYGMIISGP